MQIQRSLALRSLCFQDCFCYVFPLFEIIGGREVRITYRPKNVIPVRDYLGAQGRFKHLFKLENAHIIELFQKEVDERWEHLQRLEEANNIVLGVNG